MKRIICSGNYSYIYHGLNLSQLSIVLNENCLKSRHHFAVCFSRSLDFAKSFLRKKHYTSLASVRCVIVIDKEKLSNNYKIVPVSDNANMLEITDNDSDSTEYLKVAKNTMKARYSGHQFNKAEERCYVPLTNISKYIIKILIDHAILELEGSEEVIESIRHDGFQVELF